MTHISQLRIRGFKGIEEMKVNPGTINLITGRNNVGKTSLLESIDLVFNPDSVSRFGNNLDNVVNVDCETSSIDIVFSEQQQTLDDYTNPESIGSHRELGLREATERETIDVFSEALHNIVEMNEDYPMRVHPIPPFTSDEEVEIAQELISEVLSETVSSVPPEVYLPEARENILVVEINGESFYYLSLSQFYEGVRNQIIASAVERFEQELKSETSIWESVDNTEHFETRISRGFKDQLVPRFGSDRYVPDPPNDVGGVRLIDSPSLDPKEVDTSKDNVAIRMSDIEDYLKENNILDGLEDFSFERLVFSRDDGSKYEVPYSFMGDGFKTMVGILWEVINRNDTGDVLLLEEPDVHMHPGYIENLLSHLVTFVQQNSLQLFITTHNLDMIEGFFSEPVQASQGKFLDEEFRIIQMTKPIPRILDYEDAQEEIEKLNIDLRGI